MVGDPEMRHRGRKVNLAAIKNVSLMTIEGENDDITGKGQCSAAIDLCTGIPEDRRERFVASDCGHYGIFSGHHWRDTIYPRVRAFVRAHDA